MKILSDRYRNHPTQETGQEEKEAVSAGPLQKIWRVLYPIGIHYGISFVVVQVAAILLFSWYNMQQSGLNAEDVTGLIQQQAVLLTGIANALALIPLAILYQRDWRMRKNHLLGKKENNQVLKKKGIYAATIFFAITASHVLNDLIYYSGLDKIFPGYTQLEETAFQKQNIFVMFIVIGVVSPIVEEVVFPGTGGQKDPGLSGTAWAVALSAVIFGAYHGNVMQFVYAGLLGLAFGLIMCRTNS